MIFRVSYRACLLSPFVFSIGVLAAGSSPNSTQVGALPICAQACIASAFITCSCTMLDFTCSCRCSTFSSSAKYCIQNSCSPSLVQNAVGVISGSCLAATSTAADPPSSSSGITTSTSTRTETTTSLDPPPASSDPPNGGPTSTTGSTPTRGPYGNSSDPTTALSCVLQIATGVAGSNGSNVSSCVSWQQVGNSAQELRWSSGLWYILCNIGALLFLGWI